MKCLIIAAGRGSRLRLGYKARPKPIVELLGVPIIERVIRAAIEAGADDFFVVVGYQSEQVASFLKELSKRLNIPIQIIHNNEWSEFENGYSVLKAKYFIDGPFLLSMCDHLVDADILKKLTSCDISNGGVYLAADIRKDNELVDIDDVTKVKVRDNVIVDIGKKLTNYDAYDMGVFYCSEDIFDALEDALKEGNSSLSSAIKKLGEKNKAWICPIDNGFWIDVDTKEAFRKAEKHLISQLKKKTDGPISRYLNRPISLFISRLLVKYNITPNQITVFSFFLSAIGAFFISRSSYLSLALGGIIAQIGSIIDGCDGEIARLKFLSSDYGAWLDRVLDRYSDGLLIAALTIHSLNKSCLLAIILIGFLALIGSFAVSYTAIWFDKLIKEKNLRVFRIGRDLRVFLIFLGCVFNLPLEILVILAFVMNFEAFRRLIVLKP